MLLMGPFELHSVVTGTIRLDGGAMFGVVPKVLWQDCTDVDDLNRILLFTRTLLAVDRTNRRIVLCDTGCGSKWAVDQAQRYAVTVQPRAIDDALAALGFQSDDVTDVVVTHLHFDHNGGLTDWFDEPGGRTVLRYPRAKHWIHRKHWEHGQRPHVKDRASFFPQDFAVLADAGVLSMIEGDAPPPPFEGLEWFLSHGHTPYHLHPVFRGDERNLLFIGDLAPTIAHLRLAWVMAYDARPMTTIDEKQAIYRRCLEQGMLIAFAHDPRTGGVEIDGTVDRPVVARELAL